MVYAATAENDEALAASPYAVLEDWQKDYQSNLLIALPDTYGTAGFLDRAPEWLNRWTGIRVDSGDPIAGGEAIISWWKSRGEDPTKKLMIFSDGLDVDVIETLHARFQGRTMLSFGWGTRLTNDFRGLVSDARLDPFSLVCKVVAAEGNSTVKLSDNPRKAMGPADQISRYKSVFKVGEQDEMAVEV